MVAKKQMRQSRVAGWQREIDGIPFHQIFNFLNYLKRKQSDMEKKMLSLRAGKIFSRIVVFEDNSMKKKHFKKLSNYPGKNHAQLSGKKFSNCSSVHLIYCLRFVLFVSMSFNCLHYILISEFK